MERIFNGFSTKFAAWDAIVEEIPSMKYSQIFQHNLESDSLSQMLTIFKDYYIWNNDELYEPLLNLSLTRRFATLKMFFSENDKQVLEEIFEYLMRTHAHPVEKLLPLKQAYLSM